MRTSEMIETLSDVETRLLQFDIHPDTELEHALNLSIVNIHRALNRAHKLDVAERAYT